MPVTDLALDTWRHVVDTNLHGTFLMSRCFAQRLKAQGQGGAIINISKLGARLLALNSAVYAAGLIPIFMRHWVTGAGRPRPNAGFLKSLQLLRCKA